MPALPKLPREDWLRLGLLLASLLLFLLPWLQFGGRGYAGYAFRDFAEAVASAATRPQAAPITWDLLFLQPVAILAAGLLLLRRRGRKGNDFLAAFAIFVGPIALSMALLEVEAATLTPIGYSVFALAAVAVVVDFRPGFAQRRPPEEG